MSNTKASRKTTARLYDLYPNEAKQIKAMSIEELRASEHFQDWTEDDLISMMATVRTFTEIVYSTWARQRQDSEGQATIIPLHNQQRKAA